MSVKMSNFEKNRRQNEDRSETTLEQTQEDAYDDSSNRLPHSPVVHGGPVAPNTGQPLGRDKRIEVY